MGARNCNITLGAFCELRWFIVFFLLWKRKKWRDFRCVISGCSSKVVNLPRHLREHHSLTDHLAKAIVSFFQLRMNYQWQSNITNRKKKDLYHLKICPIPNCFAVTKRMDHHLKTQKHNLTSKSKMFHPYLQLAKVFDPNVLPDIIEYSPGIFLIESLKSDTPALPVARVTDESSNSYSLYNLNMAPDTPEKRVGKANVENFKSCYSPAEKESGFTAYIPELIKMNKSFYPKR